MAITPLGLVGNAAGGGTSLTVPITVTVPAATPAVAAHVCLLFARTDEDPGPLTVSDNAGAPLAPYTCYAENVYGPVNGGVGPGRALQEFWMGLVLAQLTGGASAIQLTWTNAVAFWRVVALGYTGIHDEFAGGADTFPAGVPDGLAWGGGSAVKVGLCYQLSWTPTSGDRIVTSLIENETPGVASLTFQDGTTTAREAAYDEGPHFLSQALGERAASGGAELIGGCTDVLPAFDTQFGGVSIALAAGVGPAACAPAVATRSCCGSRCPCKPCAR